MLFILSSGLSIFAARSMEESTSREKILKRVRDALITRTDPPFPKADMDKSVFRALEEPLDINFAQQLTKIGGKFIYCENEQEFALNLKALISDSGWASIVVPDVKIASILQKTGISFLEDIPPDTEKIDAGITLCDFLIARTGSVAVSSGKNGGRQLHVFPEVHVVMAYTSQLVPDLKDALSEFRKRHDYQPSSMVTFITGPSRTADIEKTLVMGAHGPKELYVFLIEDRF